MEAALQALDICRPSNIQANTMKVGPLTTSFPFREVCLILHQGVKISSPYLQAFAQYGDHLLVADHSGSGKTLAYLIPLMMYLRDHESSTGTRFAQAKSPAAIILAPTQELCVQAWHFRHLNVTCTLQPAFDHKQGLSCTKRDTARCEIKGLLHVKGWK